MESHYNTINLTLEDVPNREAGNPCDSIVSKGLTFYR